MDSFDPKVSITSLVTLVCAVILFKLSKIGFSTIKKHPYWTGVSFTSLSAVSLLTCITVMIIYSGEFYHNFDKKVYNSFLAYDKTHAKKLLNEACDWYEKEKIKEDTTTFIMFENPLDESSSYLNQVKCIATELETNTNNDWRGHYFDILHFGNKDHHKIIALSNYPSWIMFYPYQREFMGWLVGSLTLMLSGISWLWIKFS